MSQTAFAADADPTAPSAAQGQLINIDALTADLASLAFTQTSYPADVGPDTGQLDLGLLQNETISLGNGIQLPLLKNPSTGKGLITLGQLGAASSYSESTSNTSSKASSGVLGEGGAIAVSPNTGTGTDPAYIDLTELFDQLSVSGLTDTLLDQARLEVGGIATAAESTNDVVTSEYVLAGATLKLRSPAIGELATGLGSVVQTAVQPVSDLVAPGGALAGLLNTVKGTVNSLSLGGLGVKVNSAEVSIAGVDDVGDTVVNQLISTPIANNSGSVSIDLGTGEITLDIAKLIQEADGSDINNLPANYNVVSADFVQAIVQGITDSLAGITTKVTTILESVLDNLAVKLHLDVSALCVPLTGICTAHGAVNIDGSLAQFAGTDSAAPGVTTTLSLVGIDLGLLLNPVIAVVVDTIASVTGPAVLGVLDTVSAGLGNVVNPLVEAVTAPLEPVLRGVLDQLVTLRINEQPTELSPAQEGDLGAGSFTVRAISLGLLPDALGGDGVAKVSLASSTVRSAASDDGTAEAKADA
ncbi:choice-of-anchor G family protein, partial [Leucobacter sp. 1207-22]|uniref:choice-of-anchor G family protein n=1 Tax=Leucobacter sp. 1207-22 TaxID=2604456 RepID=UPI0040636D69